MLAAEGPWTEANQWSLVLLLVILVWFRGKDWVGLILYGKRNC